MIRFGELRKERDLSFREMAQIIGVNYSTLQCYETGKREPNIQMIKRLADFFEVTIDYLLEYSEKYIFCAYEGINVMLADSYYKQIHQFIYFMDGHRNIDLCKLLETDSVHLLPMVNRMSDDGVFILNESNESILKEQLKKA